MIPDVSGNGRTAVRASYGLTYDFPSGDFMNINASAPPWGNRSLITDPPNGRLPPLTPQAQKLLDGLGLDFLYGI